MSRPVEGCDGRGLPAAVRNLNLDDYAADRPDLDCNFGDLNRPGVSGHFTSFESESERHVIIEAVKQLSARVA